MLITFKSPIEKTTGGEEKLIS